MRQTLSAKSIIGDAVVNPEGENLGNIEELMVDVSTGQVTYAVLSFGGFLGLGDKLFALPWTKLRVNERDKNIVVDLPKQMLEAAPGFDKDNWPDLSDERQRATIDRYYGSVGAV
jgi:sporulation protein YlmC with PRC-barrel domain